jgi:hypothetical protein
VEVDCGRQAGLLQPKLKTQEARWRAETMDKMFGSVEKGEMSVEEMVTVVPTLQFIPEGPKRKERQVKGSADKGPTEVVSEAVPSQSTEEAK